MTPEDLNTLVDRTLRALGEAEPSAGFLDRLPAELAQPQMLRSRPHPFALAFRLACALCVVVFLGALAIRRLHPPQPRPSILTESHRTPARTTLASAHVVPPAKPATSPRDASPMEQKLRGSHPDVPSRTPTPERTQAPSLPIDEDAQALADLQSPSFPAPPMPATAQERLVRLMLRHGEKHDLALLDPAQATRLANTEQHSFQKFFDPDPSPELALELKKGNPQ